MAKKINKKNLKDINIKKQPISDLSNQQKKYDVFISYKRKTGWQIARLLYERLTRKGIKVFLDIDELHSGNFVETIENSIENCKYFLLVVTPGDLDKIKDPNDWLRIEIAIALNNKKPIIPIKTENFVEPKKEDLPECLQQLANLNFMLFSNNFYDTSMLKIESELKGVKIEKPKQSFKRNLVEYHQEGDLTCELKRLFVKQEIESKVDKPILDRICAKYPKLRVLAVGAHDGVRIVERFIKRKNLERLVMTESSKISGKLNIKLHAKNKKIKIYQFHMRDDSYMQNLESTISGGKAKYNVAVACQTLLCCARLLHIFKCIYNVLEPGATIIIHDVDDGLEINYPDKNGYFAKLNQLRFNSPWSGNRYTGRQIFGYLKMAGFKEIKLENSTIDTSNLTHEQRWQLFQSEYGRIKDDYKRLSELEPDNEEYANDYAWLKEHWDEIEMEYLSEDFFSCYGCMIWTAVKK